MATTAPADELELAAAEDVATFDKLGKQGFVAGLLCGLAISPAALMLLALRFL